MAAVVSVQPNIYNCELAEEQNNSRTASTDADLSLPVEDDYLSWHTPPSSPTRKRSRPSPPPPPPPRATAAAAVPALEQRHTGHTHGRARTRRRLPALSSWVADWSLLPPHVLLSIMRWTPKFHDRMTLLSVCTQWRAISAFRPVIVSVLDDVVGLVSLIFFSPARHPPSMLAHRLADSMALPCGPLAGDLE